MVASPEHEPDLLRGEAQPLQLPGQEDAVHRRSGHIDLRVVAEWLELERRCCPFLTFELRWAAGEDERARLTLTGPPGTKAFLAAELPALRVTPPA